MLGRAFVFMGEKYIPFACRYKELVVNLLAVIASEENTSL